MIKYLVILLLWPILAYAEIPYELEKIDGRTYRVFCDNGEKGIITSTSNDGKSIRVNFRRYKELKVLEAKQKEIRIIQLLKEILQQR